MREKSLTSTINTGGFYYLVFAKNLQDMTNLKERFESYIYYSIDGCWYWTGHLQYKGYGHFSFQRKASKAHRVSYIIYKGEIPDGLLVMHSCDNRSCVNPDHLSVGTSKSNYDDMVNKGRRRMPKGVNHPHVILKERQVMDIRRLYPEVPIKDLSIKYNMSRGSIYAIVKNITWRYLL